MKKLQLIILGLGLISLMASGCDALYAEQTATTTPEHTQATSTKKNLTDPANPASPLNPINPLNPANPANPNSPMPIMYH